MSDGSASAPVAVISGGSSGIGLELARQLRAKGYHLFLLARDAEKLSAAREMLVSLPGATGAVGSCVEILPLDVADEAACAAAVSHILDRGNRIDWLITCAGIVEPGLLLSQPSHVLHQQMAVNYFGTLNLVRPVATHMVKQGIKGRITMVASAVCFGGVAGMAAYTASKNAVFGLAETLHVELANTGILVSVACPADTDTPQLEREHAARPEITRRIAKGGGVMSADYVAHAIIADVESGRFLVAPGVLMTIYSKIYSIFRPFLLRRQIKIVRDAHLIDM